MCVSRFQQSSSAARVEVGGWICGRWFPRKCCIAIKESCLGLKFSYERKIMDEWIKFWHRVLQYVWKFIQQSGQKFIMTFYKSGWKKKGMETV